MRDRSGMSGRGTTGEGVVSRAEEARDSLKIGLIGCGQIAEAHLLEIGFIDNVKVVGVCDQVGALANDTAERFGIPKGYTDYRTMIEEQRPDVIHITTPAHTHLPIGVDVLERGCHAYIEKPFGIDYQEASDLVKKAKEKGKIVCAGFSQWFDKVSIRFREIVEAGEVGTIVHVESYYGNSMGGSFSKLFLQNKDHWIHKLPGKMIQNVISHPLYHIVPLFDAPVDEVLCVVMDRSENGQFNDEIRVILKAGKTTGYMTVTSSVKPITQFVKAYGTGGIIEMDLANHIFSATRSTDLPGPVARLGKAFGTGRDLFRQGAKNLMDMATGRDRYFAGLGNLFRRLYEDIEHGATEPPIPYSAVLEVSRVTDQINRQCTG